MVTVLALIVPGGGTAYAAGEVLAKNSVGTRQIEKEAVTPSKLSKSAKATLAGPVGPRGDTGSQGTTGPQGIPGAAARAQDLTSRALGSTAVSFEQSHAPSIGPWTTSA